MLILSTFIRAACPSNPSGRNVGHESTARGSRPHGYFVETTSTARPARCSVFTLAQPFSLA